MALFDRELEHAGVSSSSLLSLVVFFVNHDNVILYDYHIVMALEQPRSASIATVRTVQNLV